MKKTELLAPAGDMETLRTALRFGADAVYIGGPFMQLRASASAFSEESIAQAVKETHSLGKKLYVTVNSFAKNGEIEQIKSYAKRLYDLSVDAVIVSDLGAVCAIKEAASNLEIHISTQANCQNYATALAYYNMGAKRIVTGREMTLEEIAEMRSKIPRRHGDRGLCSRRHVYVLFGSVLFKPLSFGAQRQPRRMYPALPMELSHNRNETSGGVFSN